MSDERIGPGPWVVYMAIDDGAILIASPEDSPLLSADRQAVGVHRTQHVIGRGATQEDAEADARRELRLRGGPTDPLV